MLKSDFFPFLHFIGTLADFLALFENLPPVARISFILVNDRGERRNLNYVVTAGVYREFYTLFTPGSYRILFTINNKELAVSIQGQGMSNFNDF